MSDESQKAKAHYTPGQVALACFLGSVPAACWLMSRTYRAAADAKKERATYVWGTLGSGALLVLIFVLPDSVPPSALPIGLTVGSFHTAKHLQGEILANLECAGGRKGSWWSAVGIGLLGLVAAIAVIAAIVFAMPQ